MCPLITPCNDPLVQAVVKVAPALAAGCGAVLKPSPLASLTCVRLGALAAAAGAPRGALNVVTGGPGIDDPGEFFVVRCGFCSVFTPPVQWRTAWFQRGPPVV